MIESFVQLEKSVPHYWPRNIRLNIIKKEWNNDIEVEQLYATLQPSARPDGEDDSLQHLYIGPPTGNYCLLSVYSTM